MENREEVVTIIKPITRWEVLNLRQIFAFKDLLWALGLRDIKLRYRQTALGVIWVVLQPLMAAAIFTLVFNYIAKIEGPPGIPYFVFSFAGMLGWNLFSQTLTKSAGSLVQNSSLVSKVFFPKTIVPLSAIFASLVDFAVAFVLLLAMLPFFHVGITWQFLLLPVWVLLLLMSAMGLGLYCSALMVNYRDVQYILPVFVQMLQYASPVAYSLDKVPARFQTLISLNPLTGILEGLRWSVLGTDTLNLTAVAYSTIVIVVTFVLGALLFGRAERRFADVI